jgi:RluA family pseudouridine synthase
LWKKSSCLSGVETKELCLSGFRFLVSDFLSLILRSAADLGDSGRVAEITNVSCYRFAPLSHLKALRDRLIARCRDLDLKGTILLSTEGINLFIAGRREAVDTLLAEIRSVPGLEGLTPKYSPSDHQPFSRMLVRIKKEIIAFGVTGIDPVNRPSPKIAPSTLKQWLDEGRPVTLLDTRNAYEVKLGTFAGAVDLGIEHFRHFPEAVARLPEAMKSEPVVMFCTGGIRCEKAGPYMEKVGFENIYQLDGGILKYFEDCGGAHYHGECFVFDQRVGVDPALRETESRQCFVCQSPLTVSECEDVRYVPGESCPYCFKDASTKMRETLHKREAVFKTLTSPLPGSVPYENERPFQISGDFDNRTLIEFLSSVFAHVSEEEWKRAGDEGRLLSVGGTRVSLTQPVRAGERYIHRTPAGIEPEVRADISLLHEDEAILVLNKPAPLPMHPSGRFHKNTLQHILTQAYAPQKPRPAHRLDANTTGVVVWTRTRHFASLLQPQFSTGQVEKMYLVRVMGHPKTDTFCCEEPIRATPAELGSRSTDPEGLPARTDFRVLAREDGTTLLEAIPRTGRTNQIRVHLWHLGLPIVGDPAYLPNQKLGSAMTLPVDAPPLCLHARRIRFFHPISKEPMAFEAPLPEWAL